MRDTLIVLNYQREIPPFMQTVLHYADAQFKRILYITPQLYNDNRENCDCEKLEVLQIPQKKRWLSWLKLPAFLFHRDTVRQAIAAIKHKKFSLLFIKTMIIYGVCSDMLYTQAKKYIQEESLAADNCLLLAAWFHVEAVAAVKLKKWQPAFRAVSYAHGFEVNEDANPLALFCMNARKHNGCDEINFIAKTTQKRYIARLTEVYPQLRTDNITVTYLGSAKLFKDETAQVAEDGSLQMVSCSSAVSVKRIHLIIEALEKCQIKIHWTHMGGGPLLEELQQLAHAKLAGKENVTYTFTGTLENAQVQKYYATQPVDLFVNTSASEGLPVSIMESLSYGIPVVATDVGGTGEIATEQTGFLLRKDFLPEELTQIIEAYAAMDAEARKTYRENAHAFWQEKLDGSRNTETFFLRQTEQ